MRQALPVAASPLARVFLLSIFNMRVVNVLNQLVHVPLVSRGTAVPVANRHLVLEILFFQPGIDGRAGDVA
jgi:hypothetical protein